MGPRSIGIIGGRGRMGKMMGRFFSEAGYPVAIADEKEGPMSWKSMAENDVILLAVPISAMEGVLGEIGPFTRKDGAVIDIASVKEAPVRSMLRHCRGEVIGSHPLFGPTADSLNGRLVFVCPARSERWIVWFRSFLEDQGAVASDIEPEKHDRLMGTVQVLRHMLLLCFGRSLMRLDFDLGSDLRLSGPWFSQLVGLLDRQLDQGPELYSDMAAHNPITGEVADHFLKAAQEISRSYGSQDRSAIVRVINEVTSYMLTTRNTISRILL